MGVAMMKDLDKHAQESGRAYACISCHGGIMVPSKENLVKNNKDGQITLKNFPVLKCNQCDETSYELDEVIKYITLAEETGKDIVDCDEFLDKKFDFAKYFE